MVNGIERPLDLLNSSKGKEVLVELKNDKQLVGTLLAFDIHINVVLDNAKEMSNGEVKRNMGLSFLRGDTIIFISPASTAATENKPAERPAEENVEETK
jgi:small nuclear ribonucleoprotein